MQEEQTDQPQLVHKEEETTKPELELEQEKPELEKPETQPEPEIKEQKEIEPKVANPENIPLPEDNIEEWVEKEEKEEGSFIIYIYFIALHISRNKRGMLKKPGNLVLKLSVTIKALPSPHSAEF